MNTIKQDFPTLKRFTTEWEYEQMIQWIKDIKHARCDFDRDLVFPACGEEGSGKSVSIMAIFVQTDKNFSIKSISWTAKDYIAAQMATTRERYRRLSDSELGILKQYNINEDELDKVKPFPEGSALMPDEVGTQINSRDSQTSQNKNQVRLFISNRSLNLIHALILPRPSTLDVYIRRDRSRAMLWHEAIYDPKEDLYRFYCFGYSKHDYKRIFCNSKWDIAFSDTDTLIEMFPPTFVVQLPDVTKYIPHTLLKEYKKNKLLFGLKLQAEAYNDVTGNKGEESSGNVVSKENLIEKYKALILNHDIKRLDKVAQFNRETGLSEATFDRLAYKIKNSSSPSLLSPRGLVYNNKKEEKLT